MNALELVGALTLVALMATGAWFATYVSLLALVMLMDKMFFAVQRRKVSRKRKLIAAQAELLGGGNAEAALWDIEKKGGIARAERERGE